MTRPLVVDGPRPAVVRVLALAPGVVTSDERLVMLALALCSPDGETTDDLDEDDLADWARWLGVGDRRLGFTEAEVADLPGTMNRAARRAQRRRGGAR